MASTTLLSDVQTVVTNVSGSDRYFGFLPYHGKKLTNGESFTWSGSLDAFLNRVKRRRQGFDAAVDAGLIEVRENHRQIIYAKVDTATVIVAGDLLWYDTSDDEVKPAADLTWNTNIATTQADFANVYAGVALASHAGGSGTVTNFPVDISPTSLYEFTCTSETHQLDETLGPAKASGDALLSNKLVKAAASSSMARTARLDASAAVKVLVTTDRKSVV